MTPNELITSALKKIGVVGVGQTPLAEDLNDGLDELNNMIGQWNSTRYMLYHLVTSSVSCTGATSYSIGPSGNINVSERPSLIESAFLRQNTSPAANSIDYPLKMLPSREDYNLIAMKGLAALSQYFFYDAAYPLGLIYPYPLPSNQYSLYVTYRMLLSGFTDLNQEIALPGEYMQALVYNLAGLLCTSYDKPVPDAVVAIAKSSKLTIKGNYAQIPNAVMPAGLSRGSLYNIQGDYTY